MLPVPRGYQGSKISSWPKETLIPAAEHPADDAYLRDIEGERPSVQAQARELWLQTENLWVLWPGFIAALQAAQ